jgi:hypothetical protein
MAGVDFLQTENSSAQFADDSPNPRDRVLPIDTDATVNVITGQL